MKEFREKASTIFMSIVYILFLGGWIPIYMGYDYFFVEKCSYEEIEYETLPEKEIDAGEKTTFLRAIMARKQGSWTLRVTMVKNGYVKRLTK